MWKCPKCGEEMAEEIEDDGSYVCDLCGTAKSEPPLSNDEKQLFILRQIARQQKSQLQTQKAIHWAIVGFAIWFIIQAWIMPKILASFQ